MKVHLGRFPKTGERKMSIQIDKWDSWNCDDTLARIAVPLLKQLKETKHGVPLVDWEDSGGCFPKDVWDHEICMPEWDVDKEAAERMFQVLIDRWEFILDAMIYSLESCYTDWESKYFTHPEHGDEVYDSDETFNAHIDRIKFDKEGHAAENARIEQGLLWFGKYFRALWD